MARIPLHPKHPERICWACPRFCRADDLACGNGSVRTPHPEEIFGADWVDWANANGIEVGGPDPSELDGEALERVQRITGHSPPDCQPFVPTGRCRKEPK